MATIRARRQWRNYFDGLFGKARIAMAILASVGVVALAGAGFEQLYVNRVHAARVKTPCYMEMSTVTREVGREALFTPAWHYVPMVRFHYDAGGAAHLSETVSSRVQPIVSQAGADAFMLAHGPGANSHCYVDPDDPADAMLMLPHDGNVMLWLRGGGLALGFALFGFVMLDILCRVDLRPPVRRARAPGWGEIDAGPQDALSRTRGILREKLER
jgi:hypothetical protein